jgi:hypothetical protein
MNSRRGVARPAQYYAEISRKAKKVATISLAGLVVAAVGILGVLPSVPERAYRPASALLGLVLGLAIWGVLGSLVVLGVFYLEKRRLARPRERGDDEGERTG